MKKITNLLLALILPLGIMAQELPIDFESPEDDAFVAFGQATATVVEDPADMTNTVLELTSGGEEFDGATIFMSTFIDLSDDSNNTMTLEFWSPDNTTRTHLLQLKGGTGASPQIQLYFNTTVEGWQTITLNFSDAGPTLSDDYFILDIFADAGVGNFNTGTYYIDDINGPNGDVIPADPIPSSAAPVPSYPDSEVYAIYNDTNNYTTLFPFAYSFGATFGEPDLDPSATENRAYKFDFGVDAYGEGEGGPDDISSYNFVTFDYWAEDILPGFDVRMINQGVEYVYQVGVNEAMVNGAWTKVEIPMSFFTNQGFDDTQFFQWKIGPLNNSVDNAGVAYIDNILITQNMLSTDEFGSINEFSVFPNPTHDAWTINAKNSNIQTIELYNTLGRLIQTLDINQNEVSINASNLSSGIYFAKINSQNSDAKTIKLVKK
jgi:hypothetical protein